MAVAVKKAASGKIDRWVSPTSRTYDSKYLHRLYIGINPMISKIRGLSNNKNVKAEMKEIITQLEETRDKLRKKEDKALINAYNTLKGKDGKKDTTKIKEMYRIMSSLQSAAEGIKDSIIDDFIIESTKVAKSAKKSGGDNQITLEGAQKTVSNIVSKAVKGTSIDSRFKNAPSQMLDRMTNALIKAGNGESAGSKNRARNTAIGYLMEDIYAALGENMLNEEITKQAGSKVVADRVGDLYQKGVSKANKASLKAKNTTDVSFSLGEKDTKNAMKNALNISLKSKVTSLKKTVNLKTETSTNTILNFAGQKNDVKEAIAFALVHQHVWGGKEYQDKVRNIYNGMVNTKKHKQNVKNYTAPFMKQFGDQKGGSFKYAIERMEFNNTFEAFRPVVRVLTLNAMLFAIKGYVSAISKSNEESLFTVILGIGGKGGKKDSVKGGLVRSSDMIEGMIRGFEAGMSTQMSDNYLNRGIETFGKVESPKGGSIFKQAEQAAFSSKYSRHNSWKGYAGSVLNTDSVLNSVKIQVSLNYGKLEKTLKIKN